MLEQCCNSPAIREGHMMVKRGRIMYCLNCTHVVEKGGSYHDIAMAWNESCKEKFGDKHKELPCMETISVQSSMQLD